MGISTSFASSDMDKIQNEDNLTYVSEEILSTSVDVDNSSILSVEDSNNEIISQDSSDDILEDPMDIY